MSELAAVQCLKEKLIAKRAKKRGISGVAVFISGEAVGSAWSG
jgi:hypothetical protein